MPDKRVDYSCEGLNEPQSAQLNTTRRLGFLAPKKKRIDGVPHPCF